MSETANVGYNTIVKVGDKTFAGVTSDDLTLAPETKESITKADSGTKRVSVTRVPATITVSGICSTDATSTVVDRIGIIDMVLAKSPATVTYLVGDVTYTGTGTITNYKETTPADPDSDPTFSLDISIPAGIAKVVAGS